MPGCPAFIARSFCHQWYFWENVINGSVHLHFALLYTMHIYSFCFYIKIFTIFSNPKAKFYFFFSLRNVAHFGPILNELYHDSTSHATFMMITTAASVYDRGICLRYDNYRTAPGNAPRSHHCQHCTLQECIRDIYIAAILKRSGAQFSFLRTSEKHIFRVNAACISRIKLII